MSCYQCEECFPREGDYVSCNKCDNKYHFECSGVKKPTSKGKSAKAKIDWECNTCKNKKPRHQSVNADDDPEPDDPTYVALKRFLKGMFDRQEQRISERVNTITALITQMEERYLSILENVRELETRTINFKKEIEDLKLDFEMEKQYGRSKNFVITNIPHIENEDIGQKVSELLAKMDIHLESQHITAHRLPSNKQVPAPIIVQCVTRSIRDSVVRKARKCRPSTKLINTSLQDRPIFFNDHLTPYFADLMSKVNQNRKNRGYRFVWMNGNKIMVKRDNTSKPIQIVKHDDLDKIV